MILSVSSKYEMNTWIWGPPTWRLLHTLSFSRLAAEQAAPVSEFMETLQHVLPCVYCRKSYATFYEELRAEHGDADKVVGDGPLAFGRWMFDLHEKVNTKLDTQFTTEVLEKAQVDVALAPPPVAICRKRQLTFECLEKRFEVRRVQFTANDVWDMLCIFMLNVDDVLAKGESLSPERINGYAVFFNMLPLVVEVATGKRSGSGSGTANASASAAELVGLLESLRASVLFGLRLGEFLPRTHMTPVLFQRVLQHRAQYEGVACSHAYQTGMVERYGLVRAGACMRGCCQ